MTKIGPQQKDLFYCALLYCVIIINYLELFTFLAFCCVNLLCLINRTVENIWLFCKSNEKQERK